MVRRREPPEPPEPQCEVCDSYECVTLNPPLCEEHDQPIRRRRLSLERKKEHLAEKKVHVEMELEGYRDGPVNARFKRLSKRHKKLSEKSMVVRTELEELREKCEHEELVEEVHERPMGTTVTRRCPLCGLQEQETQE